MKIRSVSSIFWLLGAAVLVLAFFRCLHPAPKKPLPVLGQAGAFELTEKSGAKVRLEDLAGKVWIADFVFTRCAGICPLMSGHMKKLQEQLKDAEGMRFVSFSVDPDYDTPEKLSEYAARFKADPSKWLFLTGSKEIIFRLSQQHFHLGVSDVPEADRPAPDQGVTHSSRFVLVDKRGGIRGYYDSAQPETLKNLAADARGLLKE